MGDTDPRSDARERTTNAQHRTFRNLAGMSTAGPGDVSEATDAVVAHRNLLFTVAYEMLGSAADAEDVLQATWLRWAEIDQATVRDQRAFLVRITTRQALNRLRAMQRRREAYVG